MADRTVSVELRLKAAGYLAGMSAARKATRDLASDTLRATKENHRNLEQVGKAGLIAGGALAAGLGLAVRAAANFDKSLSGVRAVAGATVGEMARLRQAAIEAGQATVFSASQAADAEAELTKAGVSVQDVLGGGLAGSLDLAAAGQLELADAAMIAAQSMNIFKLKGSDVGHIADVLAAGANKSAADVKQLGEALRQGGLVSSQLGIGLEDTVGTLSAFADSALIGSDAGTSFKTMLQRLTPSSKESADAMTSIGFSAFDAQGNFVGLAKVADGLQKGLGKLTAEQRAATLNTIFGSDAVRAANVLYEEGAAGIDEYSRAVDDQGAASRMAAIQLDNLSGDLEQLKGSIETALIKSGSAGNDSLRALTKTATGAVNAISGLPDPIQKAGFFTAAFASSALLALGAIGTLTPRIRSSRDALRGLGAAGVAADAGLGKAGRAAAKAGIALAALAVIDAKMNGADSGFGQFMEEVEASAGSGTQAKISALTKELEKIQKIADEGIGFEAFGFEIKPTDWTGNNANAADQAEALKQRIAEMKHEMKLAGIESKAAGGEVAGFGEALEATSPAVEDATAALEDFTDALADTAAIDAYTATAELAESFKDLSKEIKTAGEVTNDEKITLGGFARDVRSASTAVLEQSGSQKQANDAMRDGRKQFIDLAIQAGYSAGQAKKLADRLLDIPKRTDVALNTDAIDDALAKTRRLVRLLQSLGVGQATAQGTANRLNARGFAAGGSVAGPGTGTSDSIPAMLSHGEYVVSARGAAGNRGLLDAINNGGLSRAGTQTIVRVPVTETRTNNAPVHIENLNGVSLADAEREAERRRSIASSPGWMGAGR